MAGKYRERAQRRKVHRARLLAAYKYEREHPWDDSGMLRIALGNAPHRADFVRGILRSLPPEVRRALATDGLVLAAQRERR